MKFVSISPLFFMEISASQLLPPLSFAKINNVALGITPIFTAVPALDSYFLINKPLVLLFQCLNTYKVEVR